MRLQRGKLDADAYKSCYSSCVQISKAYTLHQTNKLAAGYMNKINLASGPVAPHRAIAIKGCLLEEVYITQC